MNEQKSARPDYTAQLDDATLVELAKQGDEHAYAQLYNRHAPTAARAIQRIMRNTEDTETCCRMLRFAPLFTSGRSTGDRPFPPG